MAKNTATGDSGTDPTPDATKTQFQINSVAAPDFKTTTTPNSPWSASQGYLDAANKNAYGLLSNEQGFNSYDKDLVIPYSERTQQGMGQIEASANNNTANLNRPMNFATGMLDNGGYNATQTGALGQLGSLARGNGYNAQSGRAANSLDAQNSRLAGSGGLSDLQQRAASGFAQNNGYNSQSQSGVDRLRNVSDRMWGSEGLSSLQENAANRFSRDDGYNSESEGGIDALQDLNDSMFRREGLSSLQQEAASGLRGASDNGLDSWQQRSLAQNANIADGTQLQGGNPAFQEMLGYVKDDIRDNVNSNAMAAGRYGSGAHDGVLADRTARAVAGMYSDEYGRQLARQDAAIGNQFAMGGQKQANEQQAYSQLAGLGQSGVGNMANSAQNLFAAGDRGHANAQQSAAQMANIGQSGVGNMSNSAQSLFQAGNTGLNNEQNAYAQLANIGQSGVGNQATAAQNLFRVGDAGYQNNYSAVGDLFNAGQMGVSNSGSAVGMIPDAYAAGQSGARDLMSLGSMDEDLATRQANDDLRKFNENEASQWDRLANYNAIVNGNGQFGGSYRDVNAMNANAALQQAALKANQPSTFQNILGGASAIAGIGNSVFGSGGWF